MIACWQSRTPLAFLAAREQCWLTFSIASTTSPRALSDKLLSCWLPPNLSRCVELFFPKCRALHFLLNFEVSFDFSSLLRSPGWGVFSRMLLAQDANNKTFLAEEQTVSSSSCTQSWAKLDSLWHNKQVSVLGCRDHAKEMDRARTAWTQNENRKIVFLAQIDTDEAEH